MAYINVPDGVPGIRSLVMFRPETGKPLYELAQVLLRGPSPLSPADRELIAAYVSHRNECVFCRNSHAAAARCLYGDGKGIVDELLKDSDPGRLSEKMQALLRLAGKVQRGGNQVTPDDITAAHAAGATDVDIHDTVLIAAAFSMFNRYVDGLASYTPANESEYDEMGRRMSQNGYVLPSRPTHSTNQ
ncbi:MAG: peroxidase-related enzyme [Bacteroidota bacterium]|nr:peroxidase-related enzyme [Bacteroidota bacterium]MDP4216019.1 peroxidase-related enzyme [Bacteroidota bacterium]MDP4247423.1 peroxidase-related enzyme [Bacteroidota bacterium]MDP4254643.1 peroxidase-related enzyme [Bacteroidota bacterium]MDP4256916.1 peroxidase-related enzyme [Bacteroidota bacterium]